MKSGLHGGKGKILFLEAGHRTRRQILRDGLLPAVHRIHSRSGLVETDIHSRMFSSGYASEILPVFRLGLVMSASVNGKSCRHWRPPRLFHARGRRGEENGLINESAFPERFGVPASAGRTSHPFEVLRRLPTLNTQYEHASSMICPQMHSIRIPVTRSPSRCNVTTGFPCAAMHA